MLYCGKIPIGGMEFWGGGVVGRWGNGSVFKGCHWSFVIRYW
jgi:hypothetical protein